MLVYGHVMDRNFIRDMYVGSAEKDSKKASNDYLVCNLVQYLNKAIKEYLV